MYISKYKLKNNILLKFKNYNYNFFIVYGRQKLLTELFDNSSVLNISLMHYILKRFKFLFKFSKFFVCFYNNLDFFKYLNLLNSIKMFIYSVSSNGFFLNFNNLFDFVFINVNLFIFFNNFFFIFIFLLIYGLTNFLISIISNLYLLINKFNV